MIILLDILSKRFLHISVTPVAWALYDNIFPTDIFFGKKKINTILHYVYNIL